LEGLPEPGRFGIRPSDISRILEGEVFTPDSVLPGTILNYEDESSSVVYMLPTMNMRDPDMKVDNTLKIERLIVTREEIERFELRYGIGEPAPQPDTVPEKLPKVNAHVKVDNNLNIQLTIVNRAETAAPSEASAPIELAVPSEEAPEINRPWAFLIDSPNPKTSTLYKRDANRIWESLTDEEKKTWAREAMQRNGGNKTKTGRELGITGNGVKYILETKP
jgi:hypothetical protein